MQMHHVTEAKVIRGRNVFIAPTAYVGGAVSLGDDCTVMHHVTIRGDVSRIDIGGRVNGQDGAVIHTKTGVDLTNEESVAIGHRAVVHCTRVGMGSLIGTGSIILDDCEVGRHCLIAAGAVLTPGTIVPDGKVAMGVPGKVVRDTTEEERRYMLYVVENYVKLGRRHASGEYPNVVDGQ